MRKYSNIAQDTVLTVDPGSSGTSINVVATTGWPSPSSGDSALGCIDFGTSGVEVFEYTGLTGTSFTGVLRGVDGTTAAAHNVGAVVRHAASANDVEAFMRHGQYTVSALQSGTWYGPAGPTSLNATTLASGNIRECQWPVPTRTRFLNIGVEVTTAGAGNLRFMLYHSSGQGKPASLILDCGTASASTTGFKSPASGIDIWIPRGIVHAAVMAEGASIGVRVGNVFIPPLRLPAWATTGTILTVGYQATGVTTGAAPDPFPVGMGLHNTMPYILLQTA